MADGIKTSIGIWAFGTLGTRFLLAGYHPEVAQETPLERAKRVAPGLSDLFDGLEFHYPNEIDEDNADAIVEAIKPMDVYCICSGAHTFPAHGRGALTNPDVGVRAESMAANRRAIDLCARLGAHMVIWPGIEGYNYPFQAEYRSQWTYLLDGIGDAVSHANQRGVTVFLEHKNSEPQMKIYMRDMGMSVFVIHKLAAMGVDTSRLKINMDWQHLIMNGEKPGRVRRTALDGRFAGPPACQLRLGDVRRRQHRGRHALHARHLRSHVRCERWGTAAGENVSAWTYTPTPKMPW